MKGLIDLATLMAQHVIAEVRVLEPLLELDGQKGRVEARVRARLGERSAIQDPEPEPELESGNGSGLV